MRSKKHQTFRLERIANVLVGLSFFYWAVMGLAYVQDTGSLVRLSIVLLHLCAGALVIFRDAANVHGNWKSILGCLPSFVLGGILFRLALPTNQWPTGFSLLFLGATVLAIVSLMRLGKSFAVFPSVRSTKTSGPYAVVRHPVYLGESLMMLCCVLATTSYWSWGVFPIAIASVIYRILIEERILQQTSDYQDYRKHVKFRLIPWVW